MTTSYAKHFSTRETPQSEPIPGKPMTPNSAGGWTFAVDDWKRLERFLILGNEGGSYYATERALTIENATCVTRCLDADAARTINTIVTISDSGRAPKNDPAIFALAIACGHAKPEVRRAAEAGIPAVCRIPTHLFALVEAVQGFRGWGSGLRKAIGNWYTSKTPDQLAFQCVKYQSRNGWSHRDLLRLAHPKAEGQLDAVLRWAVVGKDLSGSREVKRGDKKSIYKTVAFEEAPLIIRAFEEAKTCDRRRLIILIQEHDLTREMVPTEALNDPDVWYYLSHKMPMTAMIRNLGKMTAVGLLKPMSSTGKTFADRLADQDYIRKSRLHPLAILIAAKVYAQGYGDKGKLKWTPVNQINDALDAAFYLAFANVKPSGKRTLLALDVSGSMSCHNVAGSPLTPREAAAAMAMVTAKVEPNYQIMAFSSAFVPLDISACSRLSDVIARTTDLPFSGTDCALPMIWAHAYNVDVDMFVVYTDSETWFNPRIHPCQALHAYRQFHARPSKLAVVGMVSNGFTIADPSDAGMIDCIGFDTSTPAVLADFAR